ncbi:MAG: hypothetical protein EBS86_08170, partial [Crocinitomicaceae bacterium]|nr:hypothetical protein [Crocinitomicaceae bacterium]
VEKFYNVEDTEWTVDNGCGISWNEAKQCALICVNELLTFREALFINEGSMAYLYLKEVKEEIEKL